MFIQAMLATDPREALDLLRAAADAGSVDAAFRYAVALQFGLGVARQEQVAASYYNRVISAEEIGLRYAARNNLAGLMELGVVKGDKDFVGLYETAAKAGIPAGCLNVGRCVEEGIGCGTDQEVTGMWEREAERHGGSDSALSRARRALQTGRIAEAIGLLEKAEGAEAKFLLGSLVGDDVLVREAAEAGVAAAQVNIGIGLAMAGEKAAASDFFGKAAATGNAYGLYNYGVAIETGVVSGTAENAADLYRRAAESGLAEAMQAYGNCLEEGRGVPLDVSEAMKWYEKAWETSKGRLTDSEIALIRINRKL
jgi:TPR repeat protein